MTTMMMAIAVHAECVGDGEDHHRPDLLPAVDLEEVLGALFEERVVAAEEVLDAARESSHVCLDQLEGISRPQHQSIQLGQRMPRRLPQTRLPVPL